MHGFHLSKIDFLIKTYSIAKDMRKDYYAILQVNKNAEQGHIKKAYRQKARRLHPDLNASDKAKDQFQELQEAYSILSNPDLRHQYDIGILFKKEFVPAPPPREESGHRGGQGRTYKYESANKYYTDYEANNKTAFFVCIAVLVFSSTFFIDLCIHQQLGISTVLNIQNKALSTYNMNDVKDVIVNTDQLSFEKRLEQGEISVGDEIEIRQSVVYKFLSFRKIGNGSFSYMKSSPFLIYLTALIVFFSGLFGITPFSKAERKFNAAIIGSFFSFALIIFLTFG